MNDSRVATVSTMERLPWWLRVLLGCCAALVGEGLTYLIPPLRAFPLLLALPIAILMCWFLGMWGGVFCALTEAFLVDSFLTKSSFRFSIGSAPQQTRLGVFLAICISLGYTLRHLARQKALLTTRELQQRLSLADAQRELAEERARASEAVRDRDDALQIALKANGMGQWIWDLRQNTVHWSDQVFEIIGVERGSVNPVENSWRQYIHPADAEGMEKALEQTRSTGADYHNHYRIIAGDGSLRWIESRGKCQLDGDGRVARVVGVLADVTLRKQSEEAMLKAEKLAVAGRLAASVAHEINNPLEAVANLLYLISITDAAETSQKYAHQAMNELMRVSMITQQTLKFHRQTGSPKLTMLSETIEAVLALFRSKCMASQIDVDLIVEDERPVPCMASEMQQIFANLVTNSMEAMPRGGKLSIRVRPSRDWRDWRSEESRINGLAEGMRVTFCDSGVGMDRATLHRIFEPFFTTKAETGTGLGMWVVSQLVERHRGQVRVWSSSRLDHSGTAISIFLPFASQPETVGGPKLAATPEMQ